MGSINIGRLILGGTIAGIVGNILGFVVDGVILASQWAIIEATKRRWAALRKAQTG